MGIRDWCIGHSVVLRTSPLSGSLNRRICGFAFGYAQVSPYGETSHIPRTLDEIDFGALQQRTQVEVIVA